MAESTAETLPSALELLTLSHSTTTAMTTYQDHVARLLDVLQGAVQCRVSRAPSVTQRKATKQLCKTPTLEAGVVKREVGVSGEEENVGSAEGGVFSDYNTVRGSASVAILFSGGVDSAVLAALADRFVGGLKRSGL